MPLLLRGSTRSRPLLTLALLAAFDLGCERHQEALGGPTGDGGTLTATIEASTTSGRAPIEVSFTSNVRGGHGAYRYAWTFGDAGTSAAANPRVQFVSGGTYDVRLQVSAGDETVTAGPLTLRFDSDLRLSCAADPGEAVAPASVSFRADAQGGTGAFAYRWDFGDGTSSTQASPVHTYGSPGTYRQVLTVTSGASSAVCSNVVTIYGVFRVTCKATPTGGTDVQFHAVPTFCLFNACGYDWDFGGSGGGSGLRTARPFFTYAAPGTYTATLNASTSGGDQAAACRVTVTVP